MIKSATRFIREERFLEPTLEIFRERQRYTWAITTDADVIGEDAEKEARENAKKKP